LDEKQERFAWRAAAFARSRNTAWAVSEENVEIVREAFEAFLEGDAERTAQLVDPELEFHGTVGGLQEGQVAHGQSEIDQTFEAEDLEAWEERRLEPEEFIDAGDDVVVLLHEYRRGRGSGVELETKTALVVAVRGGRVVRIQGYMDRDAALAAAGLSE
jgi:ketosteroid isomerase-like protein